MTPAVYLVPGLGFLIWVGSGKPLVAQGLPSRSPVLPCGAPCRARLDLVKFDNVQRVEILLALGPSTVVGLTNQAKLEFEDI